MLKKNLKILVAPVFTLYPFNGSPIPIPLVYCTTRGPSCLTLVFFRFREIDFFGHGNESETMMKSVLQYSFTVHSFTVQFYSTVLQCSFTVQFYGTVLQCTVIQCTVLMCTVLQCTNGKSGCGPSVGPCSLSP